MADIILGPVGQISRRVGNTDQAVAWYRDVLDLTRLYTFGELAFFDLSGTRLYLTTQDEDPGNPGESVIYFKVPDIHGAHLALAARGVTFAAAPHMIFRQESGVEEWMAFFTDPDGHTLAIMAQSDPVRP